ncbi:hypothetical protein [Castellaniella sp. GW247-6E4]|uniref:hypothetical protein n=1 Tax=Castellaniella sp. GW247-6E4 TaxID=3140380 RepID=UPI003315BFD8
MDYAKLTLGLVRKAQRSGTDLMAMVLATSRSSSYHKRMAAVRYLLATQHQQLLFDAQTRYCAEERSDLEWFRRWRNHCGLLRGYHDRQKLGFTTTRRKRASKRRALRGLPDDWRDQLCVRARNGKYAYAMLVAALTGCRPAELQAGVVVSRAQHPESAEELIVFRVDGVKVKEGQGQPYRLIAYRANDPHPLMRAIVDLLDSDDVELPLNVQIERPGNFTVEVRRLAKCLWPTHPHAVTAYCFRHQWAADIKSTQAGDVVSRGLGHLSAKTRRYYGQAGQARSSGVLSPLSIEAPRLVRPEKMVSSRGSLTLLGP